MLPVSSFKYDVVWYWRHQTWMPADPNVPPVLGGCDGDVDELVRRLVKAGYAARPGVRADGPPENPPPVSERLAAGIPAADLRERGAPAHVCAEWADDTKHCVLCGERVIVLRGPVVGLQGSPHTFVREEVDASGLDATTVERIRAELEGG